MPVQTSEFLVIASAVSEINPGNGWIKLFPYGSAIRGLDGRGPYVLRDQAHGQQVVAATLAHQRGIDPPIDYDHQTQRSAVNGQPAPASGWIKGLEARADGLYAKPEWTETAAARLAAREYRYISPTFYCTGPRHAAQVLRISGAGLTNQPNFALPAIASQQPGEPDSMDPALLTALGLPETTTADDATAHCQQLATGAKALAKLMGLPETASPTEIITAAQAAVTGLAAALKVTGDASLPAVVTAAQQVGATGSAVDLTKYVPTEAYLAIASQVSESGSAEVERAVDGAIDEGKIYPFTRDIWLTFASQNLPSFVELAARLPVIVTASQIGHRPHAAPPPNKGTSGLSADEAAVARQLGLTAEQFIKTKEAR